MYSVKRTVCLGRTLFTPSAVVTYQFASNSGQFIVVYFVTWPLIGSKIFG